MARPPQFAPTQPLLTMKRLVRPTGVGIVRMVCQAHQPDAPYKEDFARLPEAI
jgi:hypothetical protein